MNMKLEKNVVIEKLDSKFVVLNINTGKYLETNHIGGYVLENIDKFSNYEELLNFFYKENKIDKKQADMDLKAFLIQAKKFKLIIADE